MNFLNKTPEQIKSCNIKTRFKKMQSLSLMYNNVLFILLINNVDNDNNLIAQEIIIKY